LHTVNVDFSSSNSACSATPSIGALGASAAATVTVECGFGGHGTFAINDTPQQSGEVQVGYGNGCNFPQGANYSFLSLQNVSNG